MSRSNALAKAQRLKSIVQDRYGVRTSIELQTGRTGLWDHNLFIGTLGHHVASRRSQGLTPFLSLVKNGRSDLPGPLANGYLGFDEVFRIITFDYANHPGEGGPMTLPGGTIPRNNGRPYLFGVEVEGGFALSDWPASFREVQARMFAGILEFLGRDERSHSEHGNPWALGRKVDRIFYHQNLSTARREISAVMGGADNLEESMFCSKGSKGQAVVVLELQLRELGFYMGEIDGDYGPKVAAALLAARQARGSSVNSGDTYNGWAYWQVQQSLAEHYTSALRAGHSRQHARLKALEDLHPNAGHDPAGEPVPPAGLPEFFDARIQVVK